MSDYSQHGEQALIAEFFHDHKGFFIDIGAGDGITNSNTRKLWENGWSGILIEASLPTFLRLVENYKGATNVALLNVAIGDKTGLSTFYHYPEIPGWSSMHEDWVKPWFDKAECRQVLTIPLSALNLAPNPDLLSIDTEGLDTEIIRSLPIEFKPRLVIAETDKPNASDWIDTEMIYRGYRKIWTNTGNSAYALV